MPGSGYTALQSCWPAGTHPRAPGGHLRGLLAWCATGMKRVWGQMLAVQDLRAFRNCRYARRSAPPPATRAARAAREPGLQHAHGIAAQVSDFLGTLAQAPGRCCGQAATPLSGRAAGGSAQLSGDFTAVIDRLGASSRRSGCCGVLFPRVTRAGCFPLQLLVPGGRSQPWCRSADRQCAARAAAVPPPPPPPAPARGGRRPAACPAVVLALTLPPCRSVMRLRRPQVQP